LRRGQEWLKLDLNPDRERFQEHAPDEHVGIGRLAVIADDRRRRELRPTRGGMAISHLPARRSVP
jgi:hypothetical protein